MGKVAIVGVEGSGKTVLMAALSECYGKISDGEPYLMPENQTAYMFMQQVPHRLRVERRWPGATGIDALRSLKWTLRQGQDVLKTIEMLDYPGELYRLAFGERTAEEVAAHRAELDEFLEHLTDAESLIVLLNLADVENQGAVARNAETVWITRGIFDYAKKLPKLKYRHLVFTQADRYADELKAAGGAEEIFAKKLPMLKMLHPDLPVTAIAAVDGVDAKGFPKADYSSENCRSLMRVMLAEQDKIIHASLRMSRKKLAAIADFDGGRLDDLSNMVRDAGKAVLTLKSDAISLKIFYAKAIDEIEEQLNEWHEIVKDIRNKENILSIDKLASQEMWASLGATYPKGNRIYAGFQQRYAEEERQLIEKKRLLEEEYGKKSIWVIVIPMIIGLVIGGCIAWYNKL